MPAKTNPIGAVDPALVKMGFTRIRPRTGPKRMSMEVSGKTKAGKTRLILKSTPPIGVLNTDRSLKDLLELDEFADLDLVVKDFSGIFTPGEQLSQAEAKALESDFARSYRQLYESKVIRSIGISKWTTLWEVARFAEFGVASMKAHHYVPVNLRMRGYLGMFDRGGKNLILEQDVKEEWVGDKPTGRFIIDGFKYTPGLVQVNAQMWREDGGGDFVLGITGNALDGSLVGMEFRNDDIDFKKIASYAVPGTTIKDWR